jgi:SAM-dependent methyltransferase
VLGRLGLLSPATDLYLLFRARRAGRSGGGSGPAGGQRRADDGLPLPPPGLRLSAAGTPDAGWFLDSGHDAAGLLGEVLVAHAPGGGPFSVLDFGCGSGRVIRHLRDLDGAQLYGVDWNRRAVRWCAAQLPFARFARGGLAPPLPPGLAARFRLIYAFSVLTHLPEPLQRAWLAELAGRLEERGLLVVSTHGDAFEDQLDPVERRRYRAGELVVREPVVAGTNVCAAYHPPGALERLLPPGLEVAAFEPAGARGNPPQDLWVLTRRS